MLRQITNPAISTIINSPNNNMMKDLANKDNCRNKEMNEKETALLQRQRKEIRKLKDAIIMTLKQYHNEWE